MKKLFEKVPLLLGFISFFVVSQASAEVEVGTAAAVNPDAFGTPPAQPTRQLVVGSDLIFNERITTGGKGQTQVLFLDESTLTIGPDSEVILDEFVYDPNAKTGALSISVNSGIIKFVGGRISKQGGVEIETPNATIAVRGGIAVVIFECTSPSSSAAGAPPNCVDGQTTATFPFGVGTITQKTGPGAGVRRQVSSAQVAVQVSEQEGMQETDADTVVDENLSAVSEGTGDSPEEAGVTEESVDQGFSDNTEAAPSQTTEPTTAQTSTTTTTTSTTTEGTAEFDALSESIQETVTQTIQESNNQPSDPPTPPVQEEPDPDPPLFALPGVYAGRLLATPNAFRDDQGNLFSTSPQSVFGVYWAPKTPLEHNLLGGSDTSVPYNSFVPADTNFTLWANPPPYNAYGDPTYNRPFTQSEVQGGLLSVDSIVDLALPFPDDLVPAWTNLQDLSGSNTPYGPVTSGRAFADISDLSDPFYAYDLMVNDPSAPLGERRVFVFGGAPTPASVFNDTSTFGVTAYSIAPDQYDPSSIPFLPSVIADQFTSPVMTDLLFATDLANDNDAIGNNLWAVLAIEGEGLTQQSLFTVSSGGIWTYSGTPHLDNGNRGFVRLAADERPSRVSFGPATVSDGSGNHFFGENLDYFVLSPSYESTYGGANPDDRDETPANISLPGPDEAYSFTQVASRQATLPGDLVLTDRSDNSVTPLLGYAAGIGENFRDPLPYPVINANGSVGDFKLYTFPQRNTLEAIFDFGDAFGVSDVDVGRIAWGGEFNQSRGTYITNDYFVGRNYRAPPGNMNDSGFDPYLSLDSGDPNNLSTGGPTGYNAPSEYVTPDTSSQFNLYGRRDALASAGLLPPDSFAPDVSFCTCEFLEWGYWSSEIRWIPDGGGFREEEKFHLGTWLAGTPSDPNATDFTNLSGAATFEGHVVADVWNNGNFYVEAADLSHTWNFDTDSGQVTLQNFDSVEDITFSSGAISAVAGNAASFEGTFTDDLNNFTASVAGHFFQGGGDPAAASGGVITITDDNGNPANANYFASGTFATDRVSP